MADGLLDVLTKGGYSRSLKELETVRIVIWELSSAWFISRRERKLKVLKPVGLM